MGASHRAAAVRGDDGFTLVEMLASLGLIGVVMAASSSFLVSAMSTTHRQAGRQQAAQLATDLYEQAQAMGGAALLDGQLNPPRRALDGVDFAQRVTVTRCWQSVPSNGDTCLATAPSGPAAALARIEIRIEWHGADCPLQACVERTHGLVAAGATEPVFPS
ncbi:type II secretion system protein [Pilimelia columellifera]|uniref:Prepilin-type N-terminal cleavage/methylation domain-containing protein n=1 Tax=Pilimelia columellifera subsp. columellifera TaxID=706583 RepID=A0ABP6AWH5_9ACTN